MDAVKTFIKTAAKSLPNTTEHLDEVFVKRKNEII